MSLAFIAIAILNTVLRPVLAKWHPLLLDYQGKPALLSREDITPIFNEIGYLAIDGLDENSSGIVWLTEKCTPIWAVWDTEIEPEDWYSIYGQLVELLYNISFLGRSTGVKGRATYSYQNQEHERFSSELSNIMYFEIHPAFRLALDITEET